MAAAGRRREAAHQAVTAGNFASKGELQAIACGDAGAA